MSANASGTIHITPKQARRALLTHQGLWPPRSMRGWQDVDAYFARVGSMQFDPVDVVGISPEISLSARVRGFRRQHLGEWLYKRRYLCDVWDKNACIARVCDHPWLLPNRMSHDWGWRVRSDVEDIQPYLSQVRQRLKEEGALSTEAFRNDPAQREAVEQMVNNGQACIHHREGRRRFFGLVEDVLPAHLHAPIQMEQEQWDDWFTLRRIGAVGLLWARGSTAYITTDMDTPRRHRAIQRLLARGELVSVRVEGLRAPLYCRAGDLSMFCVKDKPSRAAFLGPLDNMLWDRPMIAKLFGFDYAWEVYTPNVQRKYGSYTLPLLYGDRFIGRMQLKQAEGRLSVDNWWPEEGLKVSQAMGREVSRALTAHGIMLGAPYDEREIL